MPFKTFVAGEVLTAADVNTFLAKQAVIVCTSGTRPAAPVEGMAIYETDTDRFLTYDGATWNLPKNVAGGTLGYAQVTANQGPPITTEVDLTGLAVTVTVAAGRRIKITGYIGGASSVSDDVLQLAVKEGATQLNRANKGVRGGNTEHWSVIWSGTPTAGAHTYKLTLARVVGTGNVNMSAGATEPAFILVEDIGGTG